MKHSSMQIAFGLVLGAGVGAAIAIIVGTGGVWLTIGIAVGVVIGSWMTRKSKTELKADSRQLKAES